MRLSAGQARQRLADARVARLATLTLDGQPRIVPVTFAADGDLIYTAVDAKPKSTTDLRRLRNIAANPQVALLADHYEDDWSALWWARADGTATVLASQAEMAGPIALLTSRYQQYRDAAPGGPVIAIAVSRWSGWSAS